MARASHYNDALCGLRSGYVYADHGARKCQNEKKFNINNIQMMPKDWNLTGNIGEAPEEKQFI